MLKNKKSHVKNHANCNHEEHVTWNRRSFIQALGLVGASSMTFANRAMSVSKPSALTMALDQAETDNILILVRLKGGNDGLNTIVPLYDYDTYANARPKIKINENELFKLNDDFGIANYATGLEKMWGDGQMRVVHGVGYENSTLSHFNGSDVWGTANADANETTGWIGRYFEDQFPNYLLNPPEVPTAIQIGGVKNIIFDGEEAGYSFNVGDPDRLLEIAQSGNLYDVSNLPGCRYGEKVGYIKNIANTTFSYSGVIHEAYDKSTAYTEYPDNELSQQLSIISRLIKGGLGTKVYMVSLSGFDTHNNQLQRQGELLTTISDTMNHFYEDLKSSGWDDKVLSMTISEFGRRLNENGSGGTDHGKASSLMLFGTGLNGNGFAGEHPDITNPDRIGNLDYTTDFRQVYTTILKDWLCADADLIDTVFQNNSYDSLDLGFTCNSDGTLSNEENLLTDRSRLTHTTVYNNANEVQIKIQTPSTQHIDVKLFNMLGQQVATLKNEILFEGEYLINVKEQSKSNLPTGQYIYQITTNINRYSKSLIIH